MVVATYNRSNVLRLTLEALRRQTVEDWEAWVVGDACTDDTADVVADLGDSRIRFLNLEENYGEQSHVNNVGFEKSRGAFIAYLNQDDLWFPDHLEIALACQQAGEADLVFAADLIAGQRTREELERGEWFFHVDAAPGGDWYRPWVHSPASTWLVRRELIAEQGGWRPAVECWGVPSQDFLFRAWRSGAKLRFSRRMTVLTFPTVFRKDSYANRDAHEQEYYFQQMLGNPHLRERALEEAAIRLASHAAWRSNEVTYSNLVRPTLQRLLVRLGIPPQAIWHWQEYGFRKRYLIEGARETRGLPRQPSRGW